MQKYHRALQKKDTYIHTNNRKQQKSEQAKTAQVFLFSQKIEKGNIKKRGGKRNYM